MSLQYVLTTAALTIVISIFLLSVFLLYRQMRKQREHLPDKEILYRDNQIKKLNLRINNLSQLNSRYLNFMLKIPAIIQRMN